MPVTQENEVTHLYPTVSWTTRYQDPQILRPVQTVYSVTFHLLVLTVPESPVVSSMFPPHELTHGRLHRKQISALGSESLI